MKNILRNVVGITLSVYIIAIIIFKQNYNTITYYIDALFLLSVLIFFFIKKDYSFTMNGLLYLYGSFFIVGLLSSLIGVDFSVSSFKALQLFLFFLNMIIIYNVLKKLNLYYYFMNGILIASFINYVLLFGIVSAPFAITSGYRTMGTMGNANGLASIMLFSIFISIIYTFILNKKYLIYFHFINILLAYYTVITTVSKKGIIFATILLLSYFIILLLKDKKKLIQLLVLLIVAYFILINYIDISELNIMFDHVIYRFSAFQTQISGHAYRGSTYEREYLIKQAWSVFQDGPIFGHGLATFYQLNTLHLYAHNNYMELLANVGLVGFTFYYLMYYFLIKNALKIKSNTIKIIFLIFIIILLFMDLALVSYSSKYLLYGLVFLIAYIENSQQKN